MVEEPPLEVTEELIGKLVREFRIGFDSIQRLGLFLLGASCKTIRQPYRASPDCLWTWHFRGRRGGFSRERLKMNTSSGFVDHEQRLVEANIMPWERTRELGRTSLE
jgi:hypothetical protein